MNSSHRNADAECAAKEKHFSIVSNTRYVGSTVIYVRSIVLGISRLQRVYNAIPFVQPSQFFEEHTYLGKPLFEPHIIYFTSPTLTLPHMYLLHKYACI